MEIKMIPQYNFEKTYKMDGESIINYLRNVYDDAKTGGSNGYLTTFLQNEEEIIGRIQNMNGKKYYVAENLIEKIGNTAQNFQDSELEEMLK
jgi:hypothetical protein